MTNILMSDLNTTSEFQYMGHNVNRSIFYRLISPILALLGAARYSGDKLMDFNALVNEEIKYTPENLNPSEGDLVDRIKNAILPNSPYNTGDVLELPWTNGVRVYLGRMLSAFCAFTDLHKGNIPQEYFPVKLSFDYLKEIYKTSFESRKPLDIADQYLLALNMAGGNLLAAAILAHSAFRLAARNMDSRVDKEFSLNLEQRLEIAHSVALFDESISLVLSPLGDTYHFWAEFSAAMASQFYKEINKFESKIFQLLLYNGHRLTRLNSKIRKLHLVEGDHETVDKMGYRIGTEIALWIKSQ